MATTHDMDMNCIYTHFGWNDIGSVEYGLRHDGTQIGVDLFQFLQQLWDGFAVVCFQHGIGRVQLLHIRIMRINIQGQGLLGGLLAMTHIAMFVVQATLFDGGGGTRRIVQNQQMNKLKW